GSTGPSGTLLDETVIKIKEKVDVPTIHFPGRSAGLSRYADAVFFMCLLHSRDMAYVITNQVLGAPLVYRSKIEPISMAYIIVEPGGTVGWVGDAKLIPRKKPEIAAVYALAGKYLGMHYTYLEAGSGADTPISPEMIGAVKQVLGENKLIVGGGIRDAKTAKLCASAGADMIVTGTILEEVKDVTAKVAEIVSAIKRQCLKKDSGCAACSKKNLFKKSSSNKSLFKKSLLKKSLLTKSLFNSILLSKY